MARSRRILLSISFDRCIWTCYDGMFLTGSVTSNLTGLFRFNGYLDPSKMSLEYKSALASLEGELRSGHSLSSCSVNAKSHCQWLKAVHNSLQSDFM